MSKFLSVDLRDVVKGLGIAVATAVFMAADGMLSSGGPVSWPVLIATAKYAGYSYILKNFISNSSGEMFSFEPMVEQSTFIQNLKSAAFGKGATVKAESIIDTTAKAGK